MRILIAAKHPPGGALKIGGVQSWCKTIGDELKVLGHSVTFWGPGELLTGSFDFGIFANVADTYPVMQFCKKTVAVCHGIIEAEKPGHGDVQLFTSEEVREYWKGVGNIINQPIDMNFWSPADAQKIFVTRFSYRKGLNFVPSVASVLNLKYIHVRNSSPREVRDILRQSAVVLATGRAALEAMAVGCPVVVADHRRAYQPALMHTGDMESARLENYSGRGGTEPNMINVLKACRDAIKTGSLRAYVEQHHDVRTITKQLLAAVS